MKRKYLIILFSILSAGGSLAGWRIFIVKDQIPVPFKDFTTFYKGTTAAMIFFMAGVMLTALWVIARLVFFKDRFSSAVECFSGLFRKIRVAITFILCLLLGIFIAGQFIVQIPFTENMLQRSFLILTRPIWSLLIVFCLVGIILVLYLGDHQEKVLNKNLYRSALIFLIFICGGWMLLQAGYGFTTAPGNGNFELTGYPILGYQVFFAWMIAVAAGILIQFLGYHRKDSCHLPDWLLDGVIIVGIFGGAYLLWSSAPSQPHMFFDQPRPPNYEIYPNSDAMLYDRTAHNLLAGGQIQTYYWGTNEQGVGRRPMLALFYAGLHALLGPGYKAIIPIQVLIFSFLPVMIYLLTRSIHSRTAGMMAAVLIIFREYNGLLLSDIVTGIHIRLFMSQIPSILISVLFLLLFIFWMKNGNRKSELAILSGGVLGISMLIRQEIGVLLPFLALIALFQMRKSINRWFHGMVLMSVGLILVVTPWIIRNWSKTGYIYLDDPGKISLIQRSIPFLPNINPDENLNSKIDPEILINADQQELKAPTSFRDNSAVKKNVLLSRVSFTPGLLAIKDKAADKSPFLNHFANQIVQSLVYLPSYPVMLDMDYLEKLVNGRAERYYGGAFYTPEKYVRQLPYWWKDWDGSISKKSILSITFSLIVISIGISGLWTRRHWIGLVPIAALGAHLLLYAIIHRSGGRYLQLMDWIVLLLLSSGWMELTGTFRTWWRREKNFDDEDEQNQPGASSSSHKHWLLYVLPGMLLVIGCLPVIVESVLPKQYTDQEKAEILHKLTLNDETAISGVNQIINQYLKDGDVLFGRALYPRFYLPGENLEDVRSKVVGKLPQRYDHSRLEFSLANANPVAVFISTEQAPASFPHAADVLIAGCEEDGVMDAAVVILLSSNHDIESIILRQGTSSDLSGCPLSWP